jgi:hypothetical protein
MSSQIKTFSRRPKPNPDRAVLWDRVRKAQFLGINEKRIAIGNAPVEEGDVFQSSHRNKYCPLAVCNLKPRGARHEQMEPEVEQ